MWLDQIITAWDFYDFSVIEGWSFIKIDGSIVFDDCISYNEGICMRLSLNEKIGYISV